MLYLSEYVKIGVANPFPSRHSRFHFYLKEKMVILSHGHLASSMHTMWLFGLNYSRESCEAYQRHTMLRLHWDRDAHYNSVQRTFLITILM